MEHFITLLFCRFLTLPLYIRLCR